MTRAAVLAVDGGNSKADVVLVARSGEVLGAVRGGTISHQQVGIDGVVAGLVDLVGRVVGDVALGGAARATAGSGTKPARAGTRLAEVGLYCLAGADFPSEERRLRDRIGAAGLTGRTIVRNDTFAALRAGATRPWGIALICGQGINGVGVAPDGRSARFDAVGDISGDWGGGTSVAMAGLAAAVRAADGRGPATALSHLVPEHFGIARPRALVRALYDGRIAHDRIRELSPVVVRAAIDGDAESIAILHRLADELATMATALLRRTHMTRLDPEVVLAGAVLRAAPPLLTERLEGAVRAVAPRATFRVLREPPVLGAALLGLDALGLAPRDLARASERLREDLPARL